MPTSCQLVCHIGIDRQLDAAMKAAQIVASMTIYLLCGNSYTRRLAGYSGGDQLRRRVVVLTDPSTRHEPPYSPSTVAVVVRNQ